MTPDPPTRSETLLDQQTANEALVLQSLRVQEEAASARGAQVTAEGRVDEGLSREAELRADAQLRELLIGVIGHDLRNPLNAVLGASSLLLANDTLSDRDTKLVHHIVKSGQRMTRLIAQVLEFTQARSGGGLQLDRSAVDLGQVCRNIAEELHLSSGTELPVATAGNLTGHWDADRLAELLSNVAGNAVDHALPDTPVVLDVHEDDEGMVVASVTNRGRPIPPEMLSILFLPFRRSSPPPPLDDGAHATVSTTAKAHLGLGLYISHEIARAHGGTLTASCSSGSTTFTLRLPYGAPAGASGGTVL